MSAYLTTVSFGISLFVMIFVITTVLWISLDIKSVTAQKESEIVIKKGTNLEEMIN